MAVEREYLLRCTVFVDREILFRQAANGFAFRIRYHRVDDHTTDISSNSSLRKLYLRFRRAGVMRSCQNREHMEERANRCGSDCQQPAVVLNRAEL